MVRTYRNEDFNNISNVNTSLVFLNFEPINYDHAATQSYVDDAKDETSLVVNIQSKNFNNHPLRKMSHEFEIWTD